MIKKLNFALLILFSMSIPAQIIPNKKQIDSLYNKRWNLQHYVDTDSLSKLPLEKIPKIVNKEIILPTKEDTEYGEIPITPFNIMKFERPNTWFFYGQNNFTFNQSSFSSWNAGGNNSIGILGRVNYTISYKRLKYFIDNNIELAYGIISTRGERTRKTEDIIKIATNYGYNIRQNYYVSAGFQILTQFSPGYNYSRNKDPKISDRISSFMAPGYLNTGIGVSYNPIENFQIIFRPINGKFTIILDSDLQKKGNYGLLKDKQKIRSEIGTLLNILYRINISKNIYFTNKLNFFSSYINHPERVDIGYQGLLNIKFNRFISTSVTMDIIYDHDQMQKTQVKQTLGIGISYNIGTENKDKNSKKKQITPFSDKML